jgi:WD repeat-containing protein 1 (actin-interacting protein 1)
VQDVRFSPSGDNLASVGSDFKIFIYNGLSGDILKEITGDSHKGSIVSTNNSLRGDKILTDIDRSSDSLRVEPRQ